MRQLIDVNFKDATSYTPMVGADVGGIAIDCSWGDTDRIVTVNLEEFLSKFPLSKYTAIPISHLTAYRSLLSGMQTMEVVRIGKNSKYLAVDLTDGSLNTTLTDLDSDSVDGFISFKYKGFHPDFQTPGRVYKVALSSSVDGTLTTVRVELYYLTPTPGASNPDIDTEEGYDKTSVEVIEGGIVLGEMIDGQDYFLGTRLNSSKYFTGKGLKSTFTAPTATKIVVNDTATLTAIYSVSTVTDLVELYPIHFSDLEMSQVSILIDPGTATTTDANSLIAVATERTDCVALIGYPITSEWTPGEDPDPVESYKATLTGSMMAAFYAIRESYTLYGRTYVLNGIGTMAGLYSYVSMQESVNQLPSAKSWGRFSGVLAKSISFAQALAWQSKGINTVYNSAQGARAFGLRSLHPRETSYYSRFNVSRVVARILKYGFGVAMDTLHTGNTDSKKALAQNLLNADLNRLKAQGVVRIESTVLCDKSNNLDIDTQGGKILNIDYDIWFVSLIERVSFSITATDSSVSATFN